MVCQVCPVLKEKMVSLACQVVQDRVDRKAMLVYQASQEHLVWMVFKVREVKMVFLATLGRRETEGSRELKVPQDFQDSPYQVQRVSQDGMGFQDEMELQVQRVTQVCLV